MVRARDPMTLAGLIRIRLIAESVEKSNNSAGRFIAR
jgi:hypothetical protein